MQKFAAPAFDSGFSNWLADTGPQTAENGSCERPRQSLGKKYPAEFWLAEPAAHIDGSRLGSALAGAAAH